MWFLDLTSPLLLGAVVLLLSLWWWLSSSSSSARGRLSGPLPPGPGPALPLLGHLHLLSKDPRPQFWAWRRQYGDVFSLSLGGRRVVVLASYSAIHEAFVNFADVFSDRPHLFTVDFVFQNKGIALSSGPLWKEQRKTALTILRNMSQGSNHRTAMEDKIQEEITHYIRAIEEHQGALMDLSQMTQVSVTNNVCSIMFGRRYDYTDPELVTFIKGIRHNFDLLSGTALLNFFPALRHLPGDPFKTRDILAYSNFAFSFMGKQVAEHRRTLRESKEEEEKKEEKEEEEDEETGDFVDQYLSQIHDREIRGDVESTLSEENLRKILTEMFIAGSETVSSVLSWAVLYLLHNPNVQEKCFQEISEVVGPHRPPTMQDRPRLVFLEATIWEVVRKGETAPFALWHTTARDVTFRGYLIPKDAVIVPSLSNVMHDRDVWGDPENFRPERFIGEDGKVKVVEEFIPFSTGRRMCLGKSLARMELFLYLATIIQHFRFLPPEEGQLPSLEGVFGLSYTAQPYKIRAQARA